MERIVKMHLKIVPELVQTFVEKYTTLSLIKKNQPMSGKNLAKELARNERIILAQLAFLEEVGLIESSKLGVSITNEGSSLLDDLSQYVQVLYGMSGLNEKLLNS